MECSPRSWRDQLRWSGAQGFVQGYDTVLGTVRVQSLRLSEVTGNDESSRNRRMYDYRAPSCNRISNTVRKMM